MKDVLYDKIRYLLDFKLNTDENTKYRVLIEKMLYDFIVELEKQYNVSKKTNAFYIDILNIFNKNVKTIIMTNSTFAYHDSGFLELSTNLKSSLNSYENVGVKVDNELKEIILRKNYYYYFLIALKKMNRPSYLGKYINDCQAINLCKMHHLYKKQYNIICPDGTTYDYYLFTKILTLNYPILLNMANILEIVVGKEAILDYFIHDNSNVITTFNHNYDNVLGSLRYDDINKKIFNCTSLLNELMKRISKEESQYKKYEYIKKLNLLVFELYNYRMTNILNSKDNEKIKEISNETKILEENMLYNANPKLHENMEHVKLFKNIRIKLKNYLSNDKKNIKNEYIIYSQDKTRKNRIQASVQPIQVGNKYVIINIKDLKNISDRILLKLNIRLIDYDKMSKNIYESIYISIKEIKQLFSITDLGIIAKENDVIRNAVANRVVDDQIMDIIINERNNYLGDFVYNKDTNKCTIYKNQSIIDYLGTLK